MNVGLIAAIGAVAAIGGWLKLRARMGGSVRLGDFVKVPIPRTLDRPLATGTRLDIAAALKKAGTPPAELRPLLDGEHDAELLERYWKLKDAP